MWTHNKQHSHSPTKNNSFTTVDEVGNRGSALQISKDSAFQKTYLNTLTKIRNKKNKRLFCNITFWRTILPEKTTPSKRPVLISDELIKPNSTYSHSDLEDIFPRTKEGKTPRNLSSTWHTTLVHPHYKNKWCTMDLMCIMKDLKWPWDNVMYAWGSRQGYQYIKWGPIPKDHRQIHIWAKDLYRWQCLGI